MAKGAPKGHPRYGGRAKGTPNKKTQELIDKALELNIDPFHVLLLYAGGKWKELGYESEKYVASDGNAVTYKWTIDPAVRARCAAEACQYLYPKRKAIELSKDPSAQEQVIVVNAVDIVDRVKALKGEK